MRRWWALMLLLAVALAGCGNGDAMALDRWELLSPSGQVMEVRLPAHVDKYLPNHDCTYVLRRVVDVPNAWRGQTLTLAIPYWPALVRLVADGQAIEALDVEPEAAYRSTGAHRFRLPPELSRDGSIELVMNVDHRWIQSGWIDSMPHLSATRTGDAGFLRARTINASLHVAGYATILITGLLYGMIYLSAPRRKSAGWFATEAICGSFFSAFYMGITQPVFGVYDAMVMGMTMSTASFASVHFIHRQLNMPPPHRAWAGVLVVTLVAYVLNGGPYRMSYWAAPFTIVTMFANSVYQSRVFLRTIRQKPTPPAHVWLVPLAWPLANVIAVADILAWCGFGEVFAGLRFGSLGIGVISLIQAIALSQEHVLSWEHADALNVELATRVKLLEGSNREIQVLNQELRHQISARSEQLSGAIAKLTAGGEWKRLRPGAIIEDRYRVERLLGAGGMGEVYEVERTSDARRLAMKVVSGATQVADLRRFALEARVIAQVSHPHVVSIVDVDIAATGQLYLVMEYMAGGTLQQRSREPKPLAWKLTVLAQIAEALHAIHKQGIVHRDLKPANVLFTAGDGSGTPHAKVADFGISTLGGESKRPPPNGRAPSIAPPSIAPPALPVPLSLSESATGPMSAPPQWMSTGDIEVVSEDLTRTGIVLGTPRYMAPELATGSKRAPPSSDVYSLGVIAYELLTGEAPYGASATVLRLEGAALPPPRPLASLCAELPLALVTLFQRAVAESPDERPTAPEIVEAITNELARAGLRAVGAEA